MGCDISQSRARVCKDSQGGIKEVYIFPFTQYLRSEIVLSGLTITDFPTDALSQPLRIYRFYTTQDISFTESQNDDLSYTQNITVKLLAISEPRKFKFNIGRFFDNDVRIIIKDNNGVYRMLGAYNGLSCSQLSQITGGSKSDFVGYEADFEGTEETPALFLSNLDLFEVAEYLLLEDGTEILYENDEFILLE